MKKWVLAGVWALCVPLAAMSYEEDYEAQIVQFQEDPTYAVLVEKPAGWSFVQEVCDIRLIGWGKDCKIFLNYFDGSSESVESELYDRARMMQKALYGWGPIDDCDISYDAGVVRYALSVPNRDVQTCIASYLLGHYVITVVVEVDDVLDEFTIFAPRTSDEDPVTLCQEIMDKISIQDAEALERKWESEET